MQTYFWVTNRKGPSFIWWILLRDSFCSQQIVSIFLAQLFRERRLTIRTCEKLRNRIFTRCARVWYNFPYYWHMPLRHWGFLLDKLRWELKAKINLIFNKYVLYDIQHYQQSSIIFDGYADGRQAQWTKSVKRMRHHNKNLGRKVNFIVKTMIHRKKMSLLTKSAAFSSGPQKHLCNKQLTQLTQPHVFYLK